MFNFYDKIRFQKYGVVSWAARFGFRLFLGLTIIYVGIDLVADVVRSERGSNQQIKSMVERYDAITIADSIFSDLKWALEDGFGSEENIQSSSQISDRTKATASSLSARFKVQMPKLNRAVDDILSSIIGSFQEAIRIGTK